MIIEVQLINGFNRPLLYTIPATWKTPPTRGMLIQVPIQKRITTAIVTKILDKAPRTSFELKDAHALEPFPADMTYMPFINQLSAYHQTSPLFFIKRLQQFLMQKEEESVAFAPNFDTAHTSNQLTDEQQAVYDFVAPRIAQPAYTPTVLHGITGSGKTEVYKKLIIETIAQGKSVMLLLPEVTLALQFQTLLRAQLPAHILLHSFHSAVSIKDKKGLWRALLQSTPLLIIGVHLPVLLPIANLGLIIVDEEHEHGYQEKKHPKIQSKEAAIWRAKLNNIPILLGSATPSITTLHNVKTKGWHFFQLKKRFAGSLPIIKTVFLADALQKQRRKNFWISKELENEIAQRLHKKEQTIIFLNRRGYSFFVQCKACSFIFLCQNCSVSLTLHDNNTRSSFSKASNDCAEFRRLVCHYCSYTIQQPNKCPGCQASDESFLKKGIGTQQIVTILEHLFPHARIGRADMDTTTQKKLWKKTVTDFESGALDILVGTQTIAKGFHFPQVTLVGIIWADLNLHFPVYNAAETTLQQLIQVAGRAGRSKAESLVIVQAMMDHPIFHYLNEIDYLAFYAQEIESRAEVGYPPCTRLVELELKHTHEETVEREAHTLATALYSQASRLAAPVIILGPAKPVVSQIKKTHARKIYLKSDSMTAINELYKTIKHATFLSGIFFTPNP